LTSAEAVVRSPDGSAETFEMTVDGNLAEVKVTSHMSGIYGVEVNILAQTTDGDIIDRAAFLTLDVEPTWLETSRNQILVAVLIVGIVMLARRWKRRKVLQNQATSGSS
jgi:hypothetical protein